MRTNIQTSILSVVRECIFAAGCKGKDVEREERRLGDQRKKWKRRRSRSCSSLAGLSSSGAPPPPGSAAKNTRSNVARTHASLMAANA